MHDSVATYQSDNDERCAKPAMQATFKDGVK